MVREHLTTLESKKKPYEKLNYTVSFSALHEAKGNSWSAICYSTSNLKKKLSTGLKSCKTRIPVLTWQILDATAKQASFHWAAAPSLGDWQWSTNEKRHSLRFPYGLPVMGHQALKSTAETRNRCWLIGRRGLGERKGAFPLFYWLVTIEKFALI